MKKERVFWTDEEWHDFARLVWNVRKKYPERSLVDIVNSLQEQLPEARRRHFQGVHRLSRLFDFLKIFHEGEAEILRTAKDKEKSLQDLKQQLILKQANVDWRKVVSELTFDQIFSAIDVPGFMGFVTQKLFRGVFTSATPVLQKQHSNIDKVFPISDAKVKVAVFGLLDKQRESFLSHVEDCGIQEADFSFYNTEKNFDVPGSKDLYVVWGRFMNHRLRNKVYEVAQGAEFLELTKAGLSTLAEETAERINNLLLRKSKT